MRPGRLAFATVALATALLSAFSSAAHAQSVPTTGALERFEPSVPGDTFLGVPSVSVSGEYVPRASVFATYAYRPLSIQDGDTRSVVVSDQVYLHVAGSFSLWNRIQLSLNLPIALAQGGDNPTVAGVNFSSPSGAELGDLRIGARLRIWGEQNDPFQLGIGGYVTTPTGAADSYSGDGLVRGSPHLLVSGQIGSFLYSTSLGSTIRPGSRPSSFDARAGVGMTFLDSVIQVGPELSISVPFSEQVVVDNSDVQIAIKSPLSAELLLGAKLRFLKVFVIGAGAGPGLTQGYGTPQFFAVSTLGYDPQPDKKPADTDGDSIVDPEDACPAVPGVKHPQPNKNGCPADNDNDGIVNPQDACPDLPGPTNADPKKNGCPDSDGDGIFDMEDACPKLAGLPNADPKKNGCPDSDGDGIFDMEDACPKLAGIADPDPKKHGCPPDSDGDTIYDSEDACPKEKGVPDPDPKKNGCPAVQVTQREIVILRQVKFKFGRSSLDQTVDPVSDDLLAEVRDAIVAHPEIKLIEVQGHADSVGPEDYNLTLSENRANAVRDWLIKRGIAADKLTAKGYGSKVPREPNTTESGRQENRRVQFVIIKRDDKP
ncbi:MAG: OmpA family protein [Polyangiaceae bacterium]|nr:OmpA family protein [Polyangiaceae bacterium]